VEMWMTGLLQPLARNWTRQAKLRCARAKTERGAQHWPVLCVYHKWLRNL